MLWRSLSNDAAARCAGFGAHVDDVVRLGHEAGVVLDHHDGVALVDETVEDIDEFPDVLEVQADGGLLDQV